ncbi:cytochrome P450 [Ceratobasidium sp. AG-I]|nr:cytochrome P450 [Ceratobasidium sp. AG-I]
MNPTFIDYVVVIGALLISLALFQRQRINAARLPLPPGPPRWPLIGCLSSIPSENENWKAFSQWGNKYGDVAYARVLNQDIIVLNSREAAFDLLERRSTMYSTRPSLVMANEIVGWKLTLGTMTYGSRLKHTRRLLQEGMSLRAMEELWPLQEEEALKFVQRLLDSPNEFIQHIRQAAAATVLKLTYGYNVNDRNDRFVVMADNAMDMFSTVTTPGAFLVDVIPSLKHLPWAPFKVKAKAWKKLLHDFVNLPMQFVHEQVSTGKTTPSLAMRWLEREVKPEEQSAEMWAAMSLYGGGADTTVSALSTFFAAMVHYPAVQAAAQAEIDRIIGTDRLPVYKDRNLLPYLEALYKEVMRWHPVAPLGIPHALDTKADDNYRGMRIPGGCMIVANIWNMVHDPKVYHDPDVFKPERFLGSPETVEPNPEEIIFGFGRRRCPGINVAHSSVWLSIALTLAVYDIKPVVGPDGKPKMPSLLYSNGTISHPERFECTITPRSSKAEALVKDSILA